MADKKISALTGATTPLAGTEVLPIVQAGATVKVAVSDLTAGRAISATQLTLTTGSVIVANGQGVDFSATPGTGTSELFADYEEGTWTPVIGGSTGTSGQTYDLQNGFYTKVGRLVTVTFRVALTAKGTITGNAQIQGLPFAINAANGGQSSAAIGYFVLATNVVFVSGIGTLGGTTINLTKLALLGSSSTNMVVADIDPSSAFMGCFSYVV